jgi:MFS family permease
MVPGSLSIIKTSYPKEEQGRTVGLWAGVSGAIAALGPLVGGALAEISWRLVFLGTFPIALFALIVTVKTIPRLETREGVKLDVAGSLLIFVGLLGFSFALIRFPAGGMSPPVIAAAAVSLIAVLGFFFVESRSKSPLIPARLFNRTVTVSNVLTFFQYFAFSGLLFLLSFNLQQLQGLSATVAGLALLPTTGLITFLSGPSGAVTDKIGARLQMWLGPLIFTAGVALLLTAGREASYFAVFLPGLALVGLGMVTIIPAVTTSALEVTGELTGAASGMNNAVSRVSGLFATALVGSILAAVFSARLEALLSASDLSREIVSQLLAQSEQLLAMSIPEELSVGEAESVRRILERAYVDGYRAAVGVIGGASAAAGLVAGIWFPRRGARERS